MYCHAAEVNIVYGETAELICICNATNEEMVQWSKNLNYLNGKYSWNYVFRSLTPTLF